MEQLAHHAVLQLPTWLPAQSVEQQSPQQHVPQLMVYTLQLLEVLILLV
jgi:hypothetical protein